MLDKIKQTVFDNKNSILYSLLGLSIFSGYLFYGRSELAQQHGIQLKNKKNKLDTTFEQLLKDNSQPNIIKIVFTEAESSSGNYRKMVIDKIKQVFPKKQLGILINCAPKKLFEAGCESFIQTFDAEDEQYADYIINLLKQELLIEDSLQKIEKVSQMNNPNRFVIMICDNNCLDILRIISQKGTYLDERIHKLALEKLNVTFLLMQIKLTDLYDMYSCVIHFEEDANEETQEERDQNIFIEKIWGNKSFRGYYEKFKYDNKKSKQDNVNVVVKYMHERIREYQRKNEQQRNQAQNN